MKRQKKNQKLNSNEDNSTVPRLAIVYQFHAPLIKDNQTIKVFQMYKKNYNLLIVCINTFVKYSKFYHL